MTSAHKAGVTASEWTVSNCQVSLSGAERDDGQPASLTLCLHAVAGLTGFSRNMNFAVKLRVTFRSRDDAV